MSKSIAILPAVAALLLSSAALAEGDPEKGEKVYKKCKSCHLVGDDAKNKVGPILNGIIDAPAGAVEGFKYSKALMEQAEAGLVWDEANLTAFLTKPKKFMKGTKMSFSGLRKEKDITNLLAFLAQYE